MTKPHASLEDLCKEIHYSFVDMSYLELAVTHASASSRKDNERLEFLGDRVLGLVVADRLFTNYPNDQEGALARRLNALVRKETCAEVAREIGLGSVLVMDESEERTGGRTKNAILGNACEALIAAIYLDGGLEAGAAFIDRYWAAKLADVEDVSRDPKTALQEWAHRQYGVVPAYVVVSRSGPDHAPQFFVEVTVGDLPPSSGEGNSKRAAEQMAAEALLERVGATR